MKRQFEISLFCILILFVAQFNKCYSQQTNSISQAILSDPVNGMVSTSLSNYSYLYSLRNTVAIQSALNNLNPGEKLLLPAGVYDVETIYIPSKSNITIAGNSIWNTTLRRKGFSWNNNTQGDCSISTEIFVAQYITGLSVCDLSLDGNSHHIQIQGYGQFNSTTGVIISGSPQFPKYVTPSNGYQNSSGSVMSIRLSNSILIDRVQVSNGYRWAINLAKIDGLLVQNSSVNTGNLSTEFKGHYDSAPNNIVMHVHTSQDGIHCTNVSNALIQYNDIHSEDSAIALELNPTWNWGGYDKCENVKIQFNYISTVSPTNQDYLLNDADIIYGTGLANQWIGQGAVDIFYNESYDANGQNYSGGATAPFRNIEICKNAIDGVRYGIRSGFFIGAGSYDATHFNHRIYNLNVHDHCSNFLAGRSKNVQAGIKNISKNIYNTWNTSGGAGIAIRNSDSILIKNNTITNITGGIGISMTNAKDFNIVNNTIDGVSGTVLGSAWFTWEGGEGIRVWNDATLTSDPNLSNGIFNANSFLIQGNKIGQTATAAKISLIATKNGTAKVNENFDLLGNQLYEINNSINNSNTQNIDFGLKSDTIICSDNFENDSPWINYDQTGAPISLNNALGGTQSYNWTTWGGVAVNSPNSALNGTKCLQEHWGGLENLQGFTINSAYIYQLEALIHPGSGINSGSNNWAAIHLFTLNNTVVWQTQGFRIRFMNGDTSGNNPNNCMVDYWLGNSGTYSTESIYNWNSNPSEVFINGSNSTNFWIPVKIVFRGSGTTVSPLIIDYYINGILVKSSSYTNITLKGNNMIGFSNNGNSGGVHCFDNIRLTKMKIADYYPPSIPTNLTPSSVLTSSFVISWAASTNAVSYDVFKDGTFYANTSATTLTIDNLTGGTSYLMTVKAKNIIGNTSASSSSLSVTTASNNILLNPGFESGVTSWTGGSCSISTSSSLHLGTAGCSVTARTATWGGPTQSIKTNVTNIGKGTYHLEAWVKMASGTAFARASIYYVDTSEHWAFSPAVSVGTSWVQISGDVDIDWTGTLNTCNFYVETLSGTTSFYADDCVMNISTLRSGIKATINRDEQVANEFNIFPNPVTNYINISTLGFDDTQIHIISIYDSLGKLVYKTDTSINQNLSIPVNDWSGGLYVIHVNTCNQTICRKIILKK